MLTQYSTIYKIKFIPVYTIKGAWGGVVVKELRYLSDGPGIYPRWCHWIF
jgi:hypothetical protein